MGEQEQFNNEKSMKITENNFIEFNEVTLLTNFQEKIGEWATTTFSASTDKSRIQHMREEIEELALRPEDPLEAADIFLLLLHHAHVNGYDLMTAAKKKFDIIKNRKWQKPDENGVVHHIKE